MVLLQFIRDEERRRTIHAAPNLSAAWNGLVQGAAFGGESVSRQNNWEAQRKMIRSSLLVANLVVFRHLVPRTRVFPALVDAGYPVTPKIIPRLSPYTTHNRFGPYERRFDQRPPPLTEDRPLSSTLAVG